MARLSFKRHRFPPDVIRHAVWLYFRFTLSFRDGIAKLTPRGCSSFVGCPSNRHSPVP